MSWGVATWAQVLELTLGQIYALYTDRLKADAEDRLGRIFDHQMALACTLPDEKGDLRRVVDRHLQTLSALAGYTEEQDSE